MEKIEIGATVLIFIIVLGLFVVAVPKLESDADHNFYKTFYALKTNTNIVVSETNMTRLEKRVYINNSCQIVFGNSNYRSGDVELCKTEMVDLK